jgi:hypothetical protein
MDSILLTDPTRRLPLEGGVSAHKQIGRRSHRWHDNPYISLGKDPQTRSRPDKCSIRNLESLVPKSENLSKAPCNLSEWDKNPDCRFSVFRCDPVALGDPRDKPRENLQDPGSKPHQRSTNGNIQNDQITRASSNREEEHRLGHGRRFNPKGFILPG